MINNKASLVAYLLQLACEEMQEQSKQAALLSFFVSVRTGIS
jgi:hypothetical protein